METVEYRCNRCEDDCTDKYLSVHVMDWGWRHGTGPGPEPKDRNVHLCPDCAREFTPSFKAFLRSRPRATA